MRQVKRLLGPTRVDSAFQFTKSQTTAEAPDSTAQDIIDVNQTDSDAKTQTMDIIFHNIDLGMAAAVGSGWQVGVGGGEGGGGGGKGRVAIRAARKESSAAASSAQHATCPPAWNCAVLRSSSARQRPKLRAAKSSALGRLLSTGPGVR